jgi:hypothetical protein
MSFTQEITQLLIVIGVLLLLLLGISFWTKRGGSITLPSVGSKSAQGANPNNEDLGVESGEPGEASGQGGGGTKSTAERLGERFELTGKDAETAARVLRGMLKNDEQADKKD